MGFLIDTCLWIDVERGQLSPADVASFTKEEAVFISPVTLAELKYGVEICTDVSIRQKRMASLRRLMKKPLLTIDEESAEIFGSLAAELKKTGRGHQFRIQDIWLASQAIQHNCQLLTRNKKDFEDIPGLTLCLIPPK